MSIDDFQTDDSRIWDILMASYQMPVMTVSDEAGLFVALNEKALTVEELAVETALPLRSVQALTDALVAMNLCVFQAERLYLTRVAARYLVKGGAYYWGAMLALWRKTTIDHPRLLAAVQSGGERMPNRGDEDLWQVHSEDDEEARTFTAAMDEHSRLPAEALARSKLFGSVRRLLDVGGGSGRFAVALAAAHSQLEATIMDLPAICPIADEYIEAAGLGDRVNSVGGDMFDGTWPQGYDAVLFSNIFHDWDMRQCMTLAQKAFLALPTGGKIYVNEMIKPDGASSEVTVSCYSLDMLLYTEGKQYSGREIAEILQNVGFVDIAFDQGSGYFWIISGRKP